MSFDTSFEEIEWMAQQDSPSSSKLFPPSRLKPPGNYGVEKRQNNSKMPSVSRLKAPSVQSRVSDITRVRNTGSQSHIPAWSPSKTTLCGIHTNAMEHVDSTEEHDEYETCNGSEARSYDRVVHPEVFPAFLRVTSLHCF